MTIKASWVHMGAAAVVALALVTSPGSSRAEEPGKGKGTSTAAATGTMWDVFRTPAVSSKATCASTDEPSLLGRCRDQDCMESCSELYWFCLELNDPPVCWPMWRRCTETCWVPCSPETPEA
jgi:hypothetical protein